MHQKLSFGCGHTQPPGWLCVDKLDYGQPKAAQLDILADWPPIFDERFDIIHTNHVLHMFTWDELEQTVLPRLHKSLMTDGVLRIADFDPLAAVHNLNKMDANALIIPDDVESSVHGKFCKYLTWYSTRKSICTPQFMRTLLLRAGFSDATICMYNESHWSDENATELDSRPTESWFVEGLK